MTEDDMGLIDVGHRDLLNVKSVRPIAFIFHLSRVSDLFPPIPPTFSSEQACKVILFERWVNATVYATLRLPHSELFSMCCCGPSLAMELEAVVTRSSRTRRITKNRNKINHGVIASAAVNLSSREESLRILSDESHVSWLPEELHSNRAPQTILGVLITNNKRKPGDGLTKGGREAETQGPQDVGELSSHRAGSADYGITPDSPYMSSKHDRWVEQECDVLCGKLDQVTSTAGVQYDAEDDVSSSMQWLSHLLKAACLSRR